MARIPGPRQCGYSQPLPTSRTRCSRLGKLNFSRKAILEAGHLLWRNPERKGDAAASFAPPGHFGMAINPGQIGAVAGLQTQLQTDVVMRHLGLETGQKRVQ